MTKPHPDRPLAALAWMCLSALGFSLMAVFVKRLSGTIPQFELVFARSAVNLAWVAALMRVRRENPFPPGKPLLVFRGFAGFAGVACMFYALARLPLPVASMLTWSSPLFVILFSRAILKERMPAGSAAMIPAAFAGLALLLDPWGAGAVPLGAAGVGLLAAAFGGMAYVAVRAATAKVGVNVIVLYFVAISTLVSAPLAAWQWVSPTPGQAVELLLLGTFATVGQLTMTRAYRHATAGVVSMMNLLNPVFGAAVGVLLFGDRLRGRQWVGMGAVALALGVLAWGRSRRGPRILPEERGGG